MIIKPITEYRSKRKYDTSRRSTIEAVKSAYAGNCIYAISDGGTGCVKVGMSTSLYRRLRALQTGSAFGSKLEGAIFIEEPDLLRALEATIHSNLERIGARVSGEWFSIEGEALGHIMRESCSLVGATPVKSVGIAQVVDEESQNIRELLPDFADKAHNKRVRNWRR